MLKMLNQAEFPGDIRLSLSIIHIRKRDRANHHISIVKLSTYVLQAKDKDEPKASCLRACIAK